MSEAVGMRGVLGQASNRRWVTYWLLCAGLGVAIWLSLVTGKVDLGDSALHATVLQLRQSRTIVAMLVGASLAVAGVVVQGVFRNPLASPSILGTSAGASIGGQTALLVYQAWFAGRAPSWLHGEMFVPLGCLAGAMLALLILLVVTRFTQGVLVLLLTGFLLTSLFVSIGAFITSLARDNWDLGRAIISFTLGDLGGSGVRQVWLVLPLALFGVVYCWFWGAPLDLMLSGEDEAKSLGLDVERVRLWSISWTAVLTAAAVSVAGNVGFVGLVVPHALRPFIGVRHRALIPACALGGAGFVVACDVLSRSVPGQAELPLGVITGLIGAPLFLVLLARTQRWRSE